MLLWGDHKYEYPGLQPTVFHPREQQRKAAAMKMTCRAATKSVTATGIGKAGPPVQTRRTATVVQLEKAKLAQAKEKNWIAELMERWRCTLPRCYLFGKVPVRSFVITYATGMWDMNRSGMACVSPLHPAKFAVFGAIRADPGHPRMAWVRG